MKISQTYTGDFPHVITNKGSSKPKEIPTKIHLHISSLFEITCNVAFWTMVIYLHTGSYHL